MLDDVIDDVFVDVIAIEAKGAVEVFERVNPNESVMNEWHGLRPGQHARSKIVCHKMNGPKSQGAESLFEVTRAQVDKAFL